MTFSDFRSRFLPSYFRPLEHMDQVNGLNRWDERLENNRSVRRVRDALFWFSQLKATIRKPSPRRSPSHHLASITSAIEPCHAITARLRCSPEGKPGGSRRTRYCSSLGYLLPMTPACSHGVLEVPRSPQECWYQTGVDAVMP